MKILSWSDDSDVNKKLTLYQLIFFFNNAHIFKILFPVSETENEIQTTLIKS